MTPGTAKIKRSGKKSRKGGGHTLTTTRQVGRPEKRGVNRWFVPSGSAGVGYTVERMPDGRWRCCCPSARWRRQQLCKHVQAVIPEQRQEVRMA
jgi:hypothetical protein